MKKNQHLISIRGSKGKGGGGSTFEADDNMFARQSAAFIDALAEGPIKGLVYGDASILIDEVRLRNVNQQTGLISSTSNFQNFTVITKNGDATQVVDADFFAEYPSAAFTQDISSAELLEGEPQYFTISSGTFEKRETDYIKVTMSTTGMSAITKKGDNKGDINETSVFFTIVFQWVDNSGVHHSREMFDTGFEGKVSGKYAHTFGFNIEDIKQTHTINDWAVKIQRQTDSPESTDSTEVQNAIYVDSIEAAIADKLEYPYTAYVGGVIDAEAFNSVPARGYEIDGKLIQIPTNHYPCDYNGRKLVLSNASAFAVGDVINQSVTASSITASGTAEDGYTATATIPAHGVTIGETFKVTIAISSSQDEDFYEGTFVATAKTSTTFTYTLNKPFNESTGAFKTLTSTTAAGTKTATLFSGGLVDKKVGNTLYLRNVAASTSAIAGAITNSDGDSGTVTSASQVFIPANYRRNASTEKPVAAEQDWDGTFYQSWCNNPAWVYNDLVTNKVYGLGNYLTQAQVNKWELFQIGRYCDELVPAGVGAADLLSIHCTSDSNYIPSGGQGEHEPRFSANLVIAGKNEAFKVLNDITSIFRGMTYWLNGEAYLVQDSEKDPVYQFTNANVIDGKFAYEGTANKTRTNSIIVNWNNPQDYYRSRAEIVELEETLQKDNEFIKPEETTAFGCTSRGQARRLGKWKLLTNNLNTNTVTFSTSLNAAFLRPGDIVQVIDQNKEGKSWGGRVSTSSSTTAINVDRKPTSFGNTSVESGYAVGDYRLTCSFVGHKAILAQDTATIGGSSFIRGAHLTSITTEEAAARLQDDSGNLVFVQWTPFTYTETQTLSAVSNSGKTLTVASAFTKAPAHEAIWVLSRAALATGKTKKEAKLFRIMSVAETEKNNFEVTGLEYNASKFDAVDKNEALTEYRTIYLPDSFKDVPAVENIDVEPKIRAAGTGGTINSLIVDWDPATNSDGTLYTSLRHYEVDISRDGEKWIRAGTNTNTELEIIDSENLSILSGTYYFKVRTVNLNGVRSPVAESGAIAVDFNRAVGPAEGSVGTDTHFINFIGNISGDFSLESGKVTFTPVNIFHNDGKNEHAVTGQAQLDFTGLDHTSTTGADEGYVYFDHSASAFKAIAFDETSGQFYPVGSNVFATGTGTLLASTSTTPRKFTGLDSTNFDGELALGNVFKYVKGSNTRYHRVKRFGLPADSVLLTFQPTRDTIVNSDNQTFSKPTFLVDYQNDTIMGKVTKTGASTYTLQKFGSSQGESPFEVHATNDNFTFDANLDGTVTNESAYTCDFTVKKGSQTYTFASSGTTQNTFGISLQARTGFDNDSDVVIDSSTGQITIGDTDMDAVTFASATMRLFDRGRANLLIADKILSFTKASQGTAGEDAKVVVVTPSSQMMTKETFAEDFGTTFVFFHPTSITVTAACTNTTQNGQWSVSGGTATTNNTITNGKATATVSSGQIVDDMTLTYTLHADDGGASDTTQLHIVELFEGSVQPIFDNIAHVFPASSAGVVGDYSGSGGTIKMYQGTSLLDYDGVGTTAGHWKVTVNNDSNITEGAISSTGSSGSRFATIADHSAMSNGTDKIILTYTITGKDTRGTAFTFEQPQVLTKSKTGADGSNGVNTAIVPLYRKSTSGSSAPTSFSGTFTYTFATGAVTGGTLNSWSTSPPSITNGEYIWVRQATASSTGATDTIATSEFSTAVVHSGVGEDGSSITGAAGNSNAVANLYRVSTSNSSSPSSFSGTFTYTFSSGLLSGGTFNSWTQNIPTVPKGQYLWVRQATASSNTATDTIAISEWSTAVVVGASGADGTDAQNQRQPSIFRKNNSSISSTSGSFANPLSGNTSWSFSVPAITANGDIVYVATRIFTSDGASPQESTWSTPAVYARRVDGQTITGDDGQSVRQAQLYKKNDTSLTSTTGGTFANPQSGNTDWSFSVPTLSANGDKVYVANRTFTSDGASPQDASWSTPVIYSQRTDGATGASGEGASTCYYLQTGFTPPSTPSSGSSNPPSGWTAAPGTAASGKSIWYSNGTRPAGSTTWTWSTPIFYIEFDFGIPGIFDLNFNWDFDDIGGSISGGGGALVTDLNWGSISVTSGAAATTWSHNGTNYTPTGTTQTLTMAITHPTFGTSSVTGTWTRGSGTLDNYKITGFALGSGSGASSGYNTWTFGDIESDAGSSDNQFGADSSAYGKKYIYVQHSASNVLLEIEAYVINTNFNTKCLTPAMLPEKLRIGDFVESPTGLTKVIDMQYKEREGYWVLEDELEITNDHPILIDGEWILPEEYEGKKEYIDEATEVVYVETENELLTVKNWTVGGKY